MFVCEVCEKASFSRKDNMLRHAASCSNKRGPVKSCSEPKCVKCGKVFSRKDSLSRHRQHCRKPYERDEAGPSDRRVENENEMIGILLRICGKCGKVFRSASLRILHEGGCKGIDNVINLADKGEPTVNKLLSLPFAYISEYETAFSGRLKSFWIRSGLDKCKMLDSFLSSVKEMVASKVSELLEEHKSLKVNLWVDCLYSNLKEENKEFAIKTKNQEIFLETDLEKYIDRSFNKLHNESEDLEAKNSGWSLTYVQGLRLRINKYNPLRASSYIPLPSVIERRKACINVYNSDSECFRYSVLSKLVVNGHPKRVQSYSSLDHRYDFSMLNYPVPIKDISKFEKVNNISINVFGLTENKKVYPLKVVTEEKADHRDLLLIEKDGVNHYVFINDFSKLVTSQLNTHQHRVEICKRCFSYFDSRESHSLEKLRRHKELCDKNEIARVELPLKKPFIQFEEVERSLRVPFVLYADFESILEPVSSNETQHKTKMTNRHIPMSFCVYLKIADEVKSAVENILPSEPYLYRGRDAPKKFLDYLRMLAAKIDAIYRKNIPMEHLSLEEEQQAAHSTSCHLCEKPFDVSAIKVKDHCHITGKFRGLAHQKCNLRAINPRFLPVFLHNLSGYDSHFIIPLLCYDDKDVEIIPTSEETFISFSKVVSDTLKIRFLDSFRFLPSSLAALAANLPKFTEMRNFFPVNNNLSLLHRKGVFPYEYVDCWDKLEEDSLPPKEAFFSKLSNCHISDEEFNLAKDVWNAFGCRTLGEYSDVYLKTDVALLADVFENFRDITIKSHKLDPAHFFTTPGLTWSAMLKYTGVTLELLTDYEMIMMIETGVRGGICQVSHRFAEANNEYMQETYDPMKKSSYIVYQDCNNLYGVAMIQPLPHSCFQWVQHDDIDIMALDDFGDEGYIFDVDLEYPNYLHDNHNDLPFLAERKHLATGQQKLTLHFETKKNYVVHYRTLKQALANGVLVTKVNRVLKFKQSCWLAPYIEYNTNLRKQAQNEFEKEQFKLYNNAVFGKTMENIRKRVNMSIIVDPRKIEKCIAKPHFADRVIYKENLVLVKYLKRKLVFNKPVYVGMSILDLSKLTMYDYHYNVMKRSYKDNSLQLLYMDTDSFIYKIETNDVYADMWQMRGYMDFSNYPPSHPCFSNENKKVLGKFKDEMGGKIIKGFVGLRPKMYALQLDNSPNEIKRLKGVKRNVVNDQINFSDYCKCLTENIEFRHRMTLFRSNKHQLYTVDIEKISLSPNDDKRIVLGDGISTMAIGHYRSDVEELFQLITSDW